MTWYFSQPGHCTRTTPVSYDFRFTFLATRVSQTLHVNTSPSWSLPTNPNFAASGP
jgi:hypothetical protein